MLGLIDDLGLVGSRAVYLESGRDSVFGVFHPAVSGGCGTAVVLCAPFGWEDVASYRCLREWAVCLAGAGHAVLRFDFPGVGDSGGLPGDAERVEGWVEAVLAAARWLRVESGASRVAAVGLTLGGVVALAAAARSGEIDDLVLWGVPAQGRGLVRELRAFGRLAAAEADRDGDAPVLVPALAPGSVEVNGFLLSAEMRFALERLDLTALGWSEPERRRVLLLERDGLAVDAQLRGHLERLGVAVSVAAGDGYGQMIIGPRDSLPPYGVIERVNRWLAEGERVPAAGGVVAGRVVERSVIELEGGVREWSLCVDEGPRARAFGVVSEPVGEPVTDRCVVLLHGAARRLGPSRMWVEAARRWAAAGIPTVRLDVEGVGDAEGDGWRYEDAAELYQVSQTRHVRAALDLLQERGLSGPFVLGGICAGAYWSFHCLLEDERVKSALMVNTQVFFWYDGSHALHDAGRVSSKLRSREFWLGLLGGGLRWRHFREFARWLVKLPMLLRAQLERSRTYGDQLDQAFDQLRETDKRLALIFCGAEPVPIELKENGQLDQIERWPNIRLIDAPGSDHSFRPLGSQQAMHALLDEQLGLELGLTIHPQTNPLALQATG